MDTYTENDLKDVIEAQQRTIDLQNKKLARLEQPKKPYSHGHKMLYNALNLVEEDVIQLETAIRLWFFKETPVSVMLEQIENSQLPMRDKIFACFLIGQGFEVMKRWQR
jgi:hypothetical protein